MSFQVVNFKLRRYAKCTTFLCCTTRGVLSFEMFCNDMFKTIILTKDYILILIATFTLFLFFPQKCDLEVFYAADCGRDAV